MYTPHPNRRQRKRTRGFRMEPGGVYVGRPTKWGNRYEVVAARICGWDVVKTGMLFRRHFRDKFDAASFAVDRFRSWMPDELKEAARTELHDRLAYCWCRLDMPCHGDVLCEIAEGGK